MDHEKRKTIVSEIDHWRRSKLLPEHYCDFLLNLYMDDGMEKPKSKLGISSRAVKNSSWKAWVTIIGIIGFLSFLGLHFTSFHFGMQTAISGVLVATFYLLGAAQREKQPVVSYLCFGVASILLLLAGIYLLDSKGWSGLPSVLYIGFCSMIWIVTGLSARMAPFHLAGWIVLFLIYAYVLRHNIHDLDWAGLQLSWVPVSLVLAWLGWLFHHVNKSTAAVLLVSGLLAWFGSEIYGFALTDMPRSQLQMFLLIKLAIAGATMFSLRKKWIEWVM